MIQSARIQVLADAPERQGDYVLYWMQASQRIDYNHALAFAIQHANEKHLPVVVYFGLTENYPKANLRHYTFMLQGLREVQTELQRRGIRLVFRCEAPEKGVIKLARRAVIVVTDRGHLRHQRQWRNTVAMQLQCPFIQVETDAVVPIETASHKEEYAAATLRPKIHRLLNDYLIPLRMPSVKKESLKLKLDGLDISRLEEIPTTWKIDDRIKPVTDFIGGTRRAKKHLKMFLDTRLNDYDQARNDPNLDATSNLSAYLHFGQISPLYIALKASQRSGKSAETFLEELIIRRELALNFVFYNRHYDSFAALPAWVQTTLKFHQKDKRPYLYTLTQLEYARTYDPYWNAAQMEMVLTGKMHGYMRMYWGKKILEWSRSPVRAWQTALYLNDTYELDGRDPNGYTGVAWCFGKHDRPWAQRPVFGKVRYMNDVGLRRKFDADAYVKKIQHLSTHAQS
ncbi:MAG: deoxyribodipyrimidine photo-lyase [Sedimentisphaerales bacterium]|nr:deoxyribodipyrimidine photo-lyase [Sedimentisphaerales bacterium]